MQGQSLKLMQIGRSPRRINKQRLRTRRCSCWTFSMCPSLERLISQPGRSWMGPHANCLNVTLLAWGCRELGG
jgi:hypothetical protein